MTKQLLFVLILSSCAMASPVSYTISFTLTSGPTAPSGHFTYDAAAPAHTGFSNFIVAWDGLTFDLTASANQPSSLTGTSCFSGLNPDGFRLLSGISVCTPSGPQEWVGSRSAFSANFSFIESATLDYSAITNPISASGLSNSARGSYSIAPVPEPSGALLVLAPLALLAAKGWRRKRPRPSR